MFIMSTTRNNPKRLEMKLSIAGTEVKVYSKLIDDDENCWGYYSPDRPQHIVLEPSGDNEHDCINFCHEVFHAICDLYALGLSDAQEERWAGVMGTAYFQAMKDFMPEKLLTKRLPRKVKKGST